jgi:hypothetical protein
MLKSGGISSESPLDKSGDFLDLYKTLCRRSLRHQKRRIDNSFALGTISHPVVSSRYVLPHQNPNR